MGETSMTGVFFLVEGRRRSGGQPGRGRRTENPGRNTAVLVVFVGRDGEKAGLDTGENEELKELRLFSSCRRLARFLCCFVCGSVCGDTAVVWTPTYV